MNGEREGSFRLFNFRQGDRSEYLALYALTRVAFVTPVPRQEDFGVVDFRCVLGEQDGTHFVPRGTFNVQVKSDEANLQLRSGEIQWISTNMDCPIFICIVDKQGAAIKLYSCQNIWPALFLRMHPQRIKLLPGNNVPKDPPYIHRPGTTGDLVADNEGEFDVYLGQPVIDMGAHEFGEKPGEVYKILDAWIKLDRFNAALMRFGRAASVEFVAEKPNELPTIAKLRVFDRPVNQHGLLDKIVPLLESLRRSYDRVSRQERVAQIDGILAAFREDAMDSPGTGIGRLIE